MASRVAVKPGDHRPRVEPNRQHALQVRARLGRSDAGLESRERVKVEVADVLPGRIEPHGDDDVERRRHVEEAEIARHDADDFRLPSVDLKLATERRRIAAEAALREAVREDHRVRAFGRGSMLGFGEPASAHRRHAERLEQPMRRAQRAHALRSVGARDRLSAVRPHADLGQRPVLGPIGEIHRRRGRQIAGDDGGVVPDPHELVRARIRQRLDQHRIDDAEDRRRRADSEREREHRGERERGAPRQRAQRMAHVATDRIHEADDIHATTLDERKTATAHPRCSSLATTVPSCSAAQLVDISGHCVAARAATVAQPRQRVPTTARWLERAGARRLLAQRWPSTISTGLS